MEDKKDVEMTKKLESEIKEMDSKTVKTLTDVVISKITCLTDLLESIILDDERTSVLGSDPIFQNAFNEHERKIIKAKIFKLIEQL